MKLRLLPAALAVLTLGAAALAQEPPLPPPPPPAPVDPGTPVDGKLGPPTSAGITGLEVKPGLDVIAAYDAKVTPGARNVGGSDWFHSFEIPRAHASLTGDYAPKGSSQSVQARVVLEAVRSASEGALLGVATDSLVLRLREASVGYRLAGWLAVDAGVVPKLTIPELDGTFDLRAVAATPLESTGLASPADLGATARFFFPKDYGYLAVGGYNGEGYDGRELNRGKNLEAALEVHPFAGTSARGFAAFVSYENGSQGTGSARADRLTAALLWQGRRLRGGAAFTYAWGVGEDGTQRSLLGDLFLRAEPIDRLLFGVRGFLWTRDTRVDGDRVLELTGAAGYRILPPLEAFLAVTRTLPEKAASEALPGLDHWDLRVIGRVVF